MEDKKIKICPVCKKEYTGYPAISRKDNKTEICPNCGVKEALEEIKDYLLVQRDDDGEEEDCIRFGELEPALIEPLERDLEVLEILKKQLFIVEPDNVEDYKEFDTVDYLRLQDFMKKEEYQKIKEWLNNE